MLGRLGWARKGKQQPRAASCVPQAPVPAMSGCLPSSREVPLPNAPSARGNCGAQALWCWVGGTRRWKVQRKCKACHALQGSELLCPLPAGPCVAPSTRMSSGGQSGSTSWDPLRKCEKPSGIRSRGRSSCPVPLGLACSGVQWVCCGMELTEGWLAPHCERQGAAAPQCPGALSRPVSVQCQI